MLGRLLQVASAIVLSLGFVAHGNAVEINSDDYQIYYGDFNGDGTDGDIYFHGLDKLILLHGDIVTPIMTPGADGFVFYQNGDGIAQALDIADDQLSNYIAAVEGFNYVYSDFNNDGYLDVTVYPLDGNGNNTVIYGNPESTFPSTSSVKAGAPTKPLYAGDPLSTTADPVNDALSGEVYYGGVNGSYSVGNDGSFNYSLPFVIPPGTQGMAPSIGLGYNSSAGNSVAGWGWDLYGFSYIHRCGANFKRDGRVSGVLDGDDYQYCMDGQRLVPVGNNEYRTESESHLHITKHADHWTVKGQSGTESRYGYDANSKEHSANGTHTWKQDKREDIFGNFLTIEYSAGQVNGADYGRPTKITYTKNDSIVNMPEREVEFVYESRSDIISGYRAGRAYVEDKRISSVVVKNNGIELWRYDLGYEDANPNKTVDDPAAKSQLDSVTRCFSNGTCQEPISFEWSQRRKADYNYVDMDNVFSARRSELVSLHGSGNIDHFFDIDGNGIEDAYVGPEDTATITYYDAPKPDYIADTSETFELTPESEYRDIDVNADGYKDIVRFNPTIFGVEVYMNEPDGSGGRQIATTPNPAYGIASEHLSFAGTRAYYVYKDLNTEQQETETYGRATVFGYNIQFLDVNKDGLIDIVRTPPVCPSSTVCHFWSENYAQDISVLLNTESGWVTINSVPQFNAIYSQWDNDKQFRSIQFSDINGDGYSDIIGKGTMPGGNPATPIYLLSNATSDINQLNFTDVSSSTNYAGLGRYAGDFDGDGLIDFADIPEQKANIVYNETITVRRGQGGSYAVAAVANQDSYLKNCSTERSQISFCSNLVVDFNNDGLDDIVQISGCPGNAEFDIDSPQEGNYISELIDECYEVMSVGYKEQVWLSKGVDASGNIQFADPIAYKTEGFESPRERAEYMQFADYNNDGIKENTPDKTVSFEELRIESIHSEAQDLHIEYQSFEMTSVMLSGGELPGDSHLKQITEQDEDYFETTVAKRSDSRFGIKRLEISNGVGGTNTIDYQFEGAKFDTASYGNLGFAKIEIIERVSGEAGYSRTESHYHQVANEQYKHSRKLKYKNTYASEDGVNEVQLSSARYKWSIKLIENDVDGHQSPHYFAYVREESANSFDLDGTAIGTSVTRNYATSNYACNDLSMNDIEIVDIYVEGAAQDTDYNDEGVLFESVSVSCDAASTDPNAPKAMTKVVAAQNSDMINMGERRGLVQTSRSASWFGRSDSLPIGSLWSQASNGVSATASCSQLQANTAPWMSETNFTFNSLGQVQSKTVQPNAGAGKTITSTYTYNTSGSLHSGTDSWTNVVGDSSLDTDFTSSTTTTSESFNGNGQRIIVTTTPMGQTTSVLHAVFDAPISQIDVNNFEAQTSYDIAGRVISNVLPNGNVTQIDYRTCASCFSESPFAQSYVQTKTTGQAASRSYLDRLGRGVGTRSRGFDGSFVYTRAVYNERGLVSDMSAPYFAGETQQITLTNFDQLGRPVSVVRPDGHTTYSEYHGLKHVLTNVNGQVQTRYNSTSGLVLRNFDNAGTPVDFTYWPNGAAKTTEVGGGDNPDSLVCIGLDDMGRKNFLDDPNTGRITYSYNALGQISEQRDAKNQVTRFTYDIHGRVVTKHDDADGTNLTHTWAYDSQLLGLADSLNGTNTDGSAYSESYSYDALGRPVGQSASYLDKSYSSSVDYDAHGRAQSTTYPGGYRVANIYNTWGHLEQVVENAGKQILWQANTVDALGKVTQATYGDSSIVERIYTPETGVLEAIDVTRESESIVDHFYDFDPLGNLKRRTDYIANQTEAFCYDELNRLVASRMGACSNTDSDFSYNAYGDIITKQGVSGTYSYGNNAGPNAVTSANGLTYSYDANGNLTQSHNSSNQLVREIEYSTLNKPTKITKDNWQSEVVYGATHSRIRRIDSQGGQVKRTTWYYNSLVEESSDATGNIRRVYYIGDFAQRVEEVSSGENYHEFLFKDHLGSLVAKTRDSDYGVDKAAFDPWGKRLESSWSSEATGADYANTTARGYTGHEHLDPVGLIHMNGRVYDPELGRFLSPDPLVQAPYNTQNYNRYSYVWNNPLSLVDPSGYYCRGADSTWDNYVIGGAESAATMWTSLPGGFFPVANSQKAIEEAKKTGKSKVRNHTGGKNGSSNGSSGSEVQRQGPAGSNQVAQQGHADPSGGVSTLDVRSMGGNNIESTVTFHGNAESARTRSHYAMESMRNYFGGGAGQPTFRVPASWSRVGTPVVQKGVGLGNTTSIASVGLAGADVANTAAMCQAGQCFGRWQGANGQWYRLGWGGNQWTGARSIALLNTQSFRLVGRGLAVTSAGVELMEMGVAVHNRDGFGVADSGLDLTMMGPTLLGGPAGFVLGVGYTFVDNTIGWRGPHTGVMTNILCEVTGDC